MNRGVEFVVVLFFLMGFFLVLMNEKQKEVEVYQKEIKELKTALNVNNNEYQCILIQYEDHLYRMKRIVGLPIDSNFTYKNKVIWNIK